jgi:hypothetical protein
VPSMLEVLASMGVEVALPTGMLFSLLSVIAGAKGFSVPPSGGC